MILAIVAVVRGILVFTFIKSVLQGHQSDLNSA